MFSLNSLTMCVMLRLRLSYIVNFILKQKAPLLGAFCILAFFKHLCCGQEFRNSELHDSLREFCQKFKSLGKRFFCFKIQRPEDDEFRGRFDRMPIQW